MNETLGPDIWDSVLIKKKQDPACASPPHQLSHLPCAPHTRLNVGVLGENGGTGRFIKSLPSKPGTTSAKQGTLRQ